MPDPSAASQSVIPQAPPDLVDVFDDQGNKGKLPVAQYPEAHSKRGFTLAVRVTSDEGKGGWLPAPKVAEAMKTRGFKLGPPEQQKYEQPAENNTMGGPDVLPMLKRLRSGVDTGMDALMDMPGQVYHAFADPAKTSDEKDISAASRGIKRLVFDPMKAELQKGRDAQDVGRKSEAWAHSIAGGIPLIGPFAAHMGEAIGKDPVAGVGEGIPYVLVPKLIGEAIKPGPAVVPKSPLAKVLKLDDASGLVEAEKTVGPKINTAATELGQKIKTANDAVAAIKQAKQNTLVDADAVAGPGKTVADLTPEQAKMLQQELDALDHIQKHIEAGQKAAADTKPQPTRAESAGQVVKGGAKMAAGAAVSPIPVVGKLAGMFGVFKGAPEVAKGLKGILSPRNLTLDKLDAAVEQTFSKMGAEPRSAPVTDVTGKPPFVPATGDLSVEHQTGIAPPETPHGNAGMYQDQPSAAQVATGSTAGPIPQRPMTAGPNLPPTGTTAALDPAVQQALAQKAPQVFQGSTARPLQAKPAQIGPNLKPMASTTALDKTLKTEPATEPVREAAPLKGKTPETQIQEVLKKSGVHDALKEAGVAAPKSTLTSPIRPKMGIGPKLEPRMDLTFAGARTGSDAALAQLTRYNINELRSAAMQRGLKVDPGDTTAQLASKIHDDLTPEEIKEFDAALAERQRFPRALQPKAKRGAKPAEQNIENALRDSLKARGVNPDAAAKVRAPGAMEKAVNQRKKP